jgi:recombinational DNA repair protein (RecF pathway)
MRQRINGVLMAYQTYTTKAIVCGTFNRNTADRSYLLFTRDAGMLYADARSVREERSRQRYALQDFSLVRVSLVKGKRGWKIGSIEAQQNYYQQAVNKAARGSVVSVCRLLRRFVKGEWSDPVLFDYLVQALVELSGVIEERSFVEQVVQVQVLGLLGYVDAKKIPPVLTLSAPLQVAKQYSTPLGQTVAQLYTQAVTVSHL